jgi:molybdate transport system regulatory protein
MNILKGTIQDLSVSGNLTLLRVNVNTILITAIVIDTPSTSTSLKIGKPITVIFKETEVIIGKGDTSQISMRNQFKGIISSIESKELLSKLTIKTSVGDITSIITSNAVNQLKLDVGVEVTAMVKTNEIMLQND